MRLERRARAHGLATELVFVLFLDHRLKKELHVLFKIGCREVYVLVRGKQAIVTQRLVTSITHRRYERYYKFYDSRSLYREIRSTSFFPVAQLSTPIMEDAPCILRKDGVL